MLSTMSAQYLSTISVDVRHPVCDDVISGFHNGHTSTPAVTSGHSGVADWTMHTVFDVTAELSMGPFS